MAGTSVSERVGEGVKIRTAHERISIEYRPVQRHSNNLKYTHNLRSITIDFESRVPLDERVMPDVLLQMTNLQVDLFSVMDIAPSPWCTGGNIKGLTEMGNMCM